MAYFETDTIEVRGAYVAYTVGNAFVFEVDGLVLEVSYDDGYDWDIIDISIEAKDGRLVSLKGDAIYDALFDAASAQCKELIESTIYEASRAEPCYKDHPRWGDHHDRA